MSNNDASWKEYGSDDDKSGYNKETERTCFLQEGNEAILQNENVLAEMKSEDLIEARFIQPCVMKVQVPIGICAGDTFIVTSDYGRVFNVVVPEGASEGAVIEVTLPEEVAGQVDQNGEGCSKNYFRMKKSTAGAAVAGAIAGSLLCASVGAPILLGGMICGAGAASISVHRSGVMGRTARKIGDLTFANMMKAKRIIEKELEIARGVTMR